MGRLRRIFPIVVLLVLLVGSMPMAASARTVDGADFAADCNHDGRVDVGGTLKVIGGSGLITVGLCQVFIAANARLVFRDTRIRAEGDLVTWGGVDSTLRIVESRLVASSLIELKTSCCFDEPDGPVNGLTKIVDSVIRGGEVYLSSAVSEQGGVLRVKRSKVRSASDILIPVGGFLQFNANKVIAGGEVEMLGHDVRVRRNDFTAVVGAITASGSVTCIATANTPNLACT